MRITTLLCAVSLLAYACGDSTSPVEGIPVSLTLLPSEFTLNAVGDTKDLTATVYDALGNVIDTTVQFEPSDPAIVTVTAAGSGEHRGCRRCADRYFTGRVGGRFIWMTEAWPAGSARLP